MATRLIELLALLGTKSGWRSLPDRFCLKFWPVSWRLAGLYRGTVARRARVIAVVGSFGKSTTARVVAAALGEGAASSWDRNYRLTVFRKVTGLRRRGDRLVLEVGIQKPGEMAGFASMVQPNVAVVTAVGSEHNRSLKTLEITRHEKAHMVRALPPGGLAVLNGDDPNVRWMAAQTRARTVTCGEGPTNDIRASDVELAWPDGMRFQLHAGGETRMVQTRLIGRHMIFPALAAAAVALAEGVSLDECLLGIERLAATPGRMEVRRLPSGALLLCDYYKSAYETVIAALDTAAAIPAARITVVLGDVSEPPGSQGPIYRGVGERIARFASRAVFVGHGFQRYAAGAARAGMPRSAMFNAGSLALNAVELIGSDLGPEDVILIKGRDTQRMDRIALALEGRQVGCRLQHCRLKVVRCASCRYLETGPTGNETNGP